MEDYFLSSSVGLLGSWLGVCVLALAGGWWLEVVAHAFGSSSSSATYFYN
jgi:CHASE2 domain-containing sensor protein